MVDTQYLDNLITDSGKSKTFLARKMGISPQNFRLKRKNKLDFRLSEVDILCTELGITRLSDKEKIFFMK